MGPPGRHDCSCGGESWGSGSVKTRFCFACNSRLLSISVDTLGDSVVWLWSGVEWMVNPCGARRQPHMGLYKVRPLGL